MCHNMSLFSPSLDNDLKIRAQHIYGEHFHTKDPGTGNWIPLQPGGDGEPVALPYYIQNDSIQFTNARGINSAFVNDVDNMQNVILPAHESSLEELDGRVFGNTNNITELGNRMVAVEGVNTTQGANITALQTKTANIAQSGSTSLTMGFASTASNRAQLNSAGLVVYSGSPSVIPTGSVPRVTVKPDSIAFTDSTGGGVYLDMARVDNIAKLASVTTIDFNDKLNLTKGVTFPGAVESTTTTNKKMVVMDATTKALSYATIPSGGATLPSYLKENNILMTSATNSLYLSPSMIEFGRTVGGNNEVLQLDMDSFANLVPDPAIKNIPKQSKWVAPNYTTMGGTAPTVVSNGEVHNFDKPLYFFNEMHKPEDTLWIDLSTWNATVGTTNETSRGIFLSFKAFEWSENHTYEITYSQTNATLTTQEVYVFNTTTDGRRALFLWFKSNSGNVSVNGWVKIKLGNTFKTPVFPGVSQAYPSSAVQP